MRKKARERDPAFNYTPYILGEKVPVAVYGSESFPGVRELLAIAAKHRSKFEDFYPKNVVAASKRLLANRSQTLTDFESSFLSERSDSKQGPKPSSAPKPPCIANAALGGRKNIILTGVFPYGHENLTNVLSQFHTVRIDKVLPDHTDYLVIGRKQFCEKTIENTIKTFGNTVKYLPQEAFIDLILFGHDWYEYTASLEDLAETHPGLRFLLSCQGFAWPSTEAPESQGFGDEEGNFQKETDLFKLGYRIDGTNRAARWDILTNRAIPALGLKEVVCTIANHIRVRKTQRGGRLKYSYAIGEWEWDLEHLKKECYKGSFQWPDFK